MSNSASRISKRDNNGKTIFQENVLQGNFTSNPVEGRQCVWFKNHIRNAGGFKKYSDGTSANKDAIGWPIDNDWNTMTGWPGFEDLIYAIDPATGPIGSITHCICEGDVGKPFPIASNGGCDLMNQVLLADGVTWTFDYKTTGYVIQICGAVGAGGVRNIRIPVLGHDINTCEEGSKFVPEFPNYIKQFYGIRTMAGYTDSGSNWDTTLGNWDVWPRTNNTICGFSISTPAGNMDSLTPIELYLEVCNEAYDLPGSNFRKLWVNIHHMATDDFVTKFATLIRDTLNPNIEVQVEYSNEVWNYTFSQASWCLSQSQNPTIAATAQLHYDGNRDLNVCRGRMYAWYALQAKLIFDTVWAERPGYRLPFKFILAWQMYAGMSWFPTYIEHVTNKPFSETFYGLAVAPYFNLSTSISNYSEINTDTLCRAFFDSINQNIIGNSSYPSLIGANTSIDFADRIPMSQSVITSVPDNSSQNLSYLKELCLVYNTNLVGYEGGWDYANTLPDSQTPLIVSAILSKKFQNILYFFLQSILYSGIEFHWFGMSPTGWMRNGSYSSYNFSLVEGYNDLNPPLQTFNEIGNTKITPDDVLARNKFPNVIGANSNIWFTNYVNTYYDFSGSLTPTVVPTYDGSTYGYTGVWCFPNSAGPYTWLATWGGIVKWLNLGVYIPYDGEYSIDFYGSGGNYLTYTKDTSSNVGMIEVPYGGSTYKGKPLIDANNALLPDNISNGNTSLELYIRDFNPSSSAGIIDDANYVGFTKIGEFNNWPVLGNGYNPIKSYGDPLVVSLTAGWKALRASINTKGYIRWSGAVQGTSIKTGGSGYTNPIVVFPSPESGGVQATGIAYIGIDDTGVSTGQIAWISVTCSGSGYTNTLSGYTRRPDGVEYLPGPDIIDPTGVGCTWFAEFSSQGAGTQNTYLRDQYNDIVLDANNNPIILQSEQNSIQLGLSHLNITRVS